jgi:hypothetical protein
VTTADGPGSDSPWSEPPMAEGCDRPIPAQRMGTSHVPRHLCRYLPTISFQVQVGAHTSTPQVTATWNAEAWD